MIEFPTEPINNIEDALGDAEEATNEMEHGLEQLDSLARKKALAESADMLTKAERSDDISVMDRITALDASLAQRMVDLLKFVGDKKQVRYGYPSFPAVRWIDLRAAHVLREGGFLGIYLDGTRNIDPQTLAILIHSGAEVSFNGLDHLNEAHSRVLKENSLHHKILLNGLKHCSQEEAAALSGYEGVSLDGLTDVGELVIQALLESPGRKQSPLTRLSLQGLRSLRSDIAQQFKTLRSDCFLFLDGLEELSIESASELGKFKGSISLYGLKTISAGVLRAVSKKPEVIRFDELRQLDQETIGLIVDGILDKSLYFKNAVMKNAILDPREWGTFKAKP